MSYLLIMIVFIRILYLRRATFPCLQFIESLLAQLLLTTLCNRFVSGQSEPAPFLMQAIELAYGRGAHRGLTTRLNILNEFNKHLIFLYIRVYLLAVFDLLDELQSLAHQHRFTLAFCGSSNSRSVHLSGLPTVTITICSPAGT